MSFIKKNWKRGDKLTVKELNRIEDALNYVFINTLITISCNAYAGEEEGEFLVTDYSCTPEELKAYIKNHQNLQLTVTFKTPGHNDDIATYSLESFTENSVSFGQTDILLVLSVENNTINYEVIDR